MSQNLFQKLTVFCTRIFLALLVTAFFLPAFTALTGCAKKAKPQEQPAEVYYRHNVRYSGETLSIIAAWYTGTAKNWPLIASHNPGLDIRKIRVGDVILIPESLMLKQKKGFNEQYVQNFNRGAAAKPDEQQVAEGAQVKTPEAEVKNTIEEVKIPEPTATIHEEIHLVDEIPGREISPKGKDIQTVSAETPAATPEPLATVPEIPTPAPEVKALVPTPAAPIPTETEEERKLKREKLLQELLGEPTR